jgi:hypothetical protein
VDDDPTAGGLHADELESGRGGPIGEKALAVTQDDRVNEQAVLIDEAVLHERPDERRAPMDLQFVAGLVLQLATSTATSP